MGAAEPFTPQLLVAAYASGYFPMADIQSARPGDAAEILWYSPDPRAVIPLEAGGLHVPRSLERTIRRGTFQMTSDVCFERIMRECAAPRADQGAENSWISEEMIATYSEVHRHGFAHSLEAWTIKDGSRTLVGGIYGIAIGGAFFAESMFCRPAEGGTDASKVALVTLVRHLAECGYDICDVQIANPHTQRFGVVPVPRKQFLRALRAAASRPNAWRPLDSGGATTPRIEKSLPL